MLEFLGKVPPFLRDVFCCCQLSCPRRPGGATIDNYEGSAGVIDGIDEIAGQCGISGKFGISAPPSFCHQVDHHSWVGLGLGLRLGRRLVVVGIGEGWHTFPQSSRHLF